MVIVNADDFGISTEVNQAIKELFSKRIISSTTLMTNMPAVENAVHIAFESGFEDSVGLHFNLIEGKPLTQDIQSCSRFCTGGRLSYKRNSARILTKKEKSAIRQEFLAQLQKMKELGLTPSHIDSHQHVHTELGVYLAIRKDLKKEGIRAVRIGRNVGVGLLSKMYKLLLNSLLRIDGFKTVDYFIPLWETLPNKEANYIVEYMCHPIMKGDTIVDAFSDNVFSNEIKIDNLVNYRAI